MNTKWVIAVSPVVVFWAMGLEANAETMVKKCQLIDGAPSYWIILTIIQIVLIAGIVWLLFKRGLFKKSSKNQEISPKQTERVETEEPGQPVTASEATTTPETEAEVENINNRNESDDEEPQSKLPPTILQDATLLFVDDDMDLLDYFRDELESIVRKAFFAPNGVKAIEILKNHQIDVIVSDIMMPEMDGYALCRHIKTTVEVSHIPVILLTTRSDEQSRLLGYKNGADDYLTKPFDIEQLTDCISKLFLKREFSRDLFANNTAQMPDTKQVTFSSADEKFMERFNKLINDNLSDPEFSVKNLVQEMNLSRTFLYNKVTTLTGLNIKEYIGKIRIEYAMKLLRETDMSIAEIAEKSGFSCSRYFSTAFKIATGTTPSQYRKE